MPRSTWTTVGLAALTGLLLAACGGDGHDGPPPTADPLAVPPAATATPLAFTDYVGSRPPDDTAEPLRLEGVEPPVTDDEEPVPVG